MSMQKTVAPEDNNWGDIAVAPIPALRTQKLGEQDRKRLLERTDEALLSKFGTLHLEPGEKPIHVVALGAYEHYGCFSAGTQIAMGSGHYTPIEKIAVDDLVLSADGHECPVSAVFSRTVPSTLQLDVCGLPDTLRCSLNHPFRVARYEQFQCAHDVHKRCLPQLQGLQHICQRATPPWACVTHPFGTIEHHWAEAETLRVGDFLVWTAPDLAPPLTMGVEEGYLLGAWLAEGSFVRNNSNGAVASARLSIHADEGAFLAKLQKCAEALQLTIRDYNYPSDPNARIVDFSGNPARFRTWFGHFGAGARYKVLPPWVCNLDYATRCAIVAGYLDGDGSCVVNAKENRTTARTYGKDLALGLLRLAWSLGLPAVCCNVHAPEGTNAAWNIAIANSYLGALAEFSWKIRGRALQQTTKVHGFAHEGRMYLPIRDIQVLGAGQVYNIEVAGDHTYSGPNVDSHNCNRNGDAFYRDVCRQYHPTFPKNAKFYRGHKSGPGAPFFGNVKLSHFNEKMQRIELIATLFESAAAAKKAGAHGQVADIELQKLASGQDISTSMGCTADPLTPVLTLTGYKPISQVQVGDMVLTHMGRWQPVTHTMRRQYTGVIADLDVEGLPEIVPLTANHPMFAKMLSGYPVMARIAGKPNNRPLAQWTAEVRKGQAPFDWVCAEHLQPDDRIAFTNLAPSEVHATIDCVHFAQILGTYLAEGSVQHCGDNPNTAIFTVNTTDWATTHLPEILRTLWPELTVGLRPKKNCTVSFDLCAYSAELSRWLLKLCGHGAKTKVIPPELYGATREVKTAVLGRWLDGDGWCDKKGAHWSSCNYGLVLQGRDLLASIGVPASIYKIPARKTKSGFGRKSHEYSLNVSNLDAHHLSAFSQKVAESPWVCARQRTKPAALYQFESHGAYRVKKVVLRHVEDVTVYNLEVAEDHSYSMQGLASHNCLVSHDICSSCGNKAKTPKDYCTDRTCKMGGLKKHMGELVDDGTVLHAINPDPTFNDISQVRRGADRISYVMGALHKAAAHGLDPEILALSYVPAGETRLSREAAKLAELEDNLHNFQQWHAGCGPFGREHAFTVPHGIDGPQKLAQALAALADQQIILPVEEFVTLLSGGKDAARTVKQAAVGIFDRLQAPLANPFDYTGATSGAYQLWAARLAPDYALTKKAVQRRIGIAALRGLAVPFTSNVPVVKQAHDNALAEEVAQQYGLYVLSALARQTKNANLGLTAALGLLQNRGC